MPRSRYNLAGDFISRNDEPKTAMLGEFGTQVLKLAESLGNRRNKNGKGLDALACHWTPLGSRALPLPALEARAQDSLADANHRPSAVQLLPFLSFGSPLQFHHMAFFHSLLPPSTTARSAQLHQLPLAPPSASGDSLQHHRHSPSFRGKIALSLLCPANTQPRRIHSRSFPPMPRPAVTTLPWM